MKFIIVRGARLRLSLAATLSTMEGLKVVCYGFEVSFGRICKVANYRPFRSRAQSITETAICLNISRQTVSKLWKQFQNDGTVVRRPGQGRKRMTTASEDRYLALTARRNRKATARHLSSELAAATGAVASWQTIYRRLNKKAFMPESQGGAYGRDFLFMDDNARPHRANLVDEFLESEEIKRIPWPANSPDLNPIENLWDYLEEPLHVDILPS
ncbi:transposable element Tc1 transposase [Trichonephila clavipes]|nr:transposable element Tc1 transposase [Trichonephila clavipes]